MPSNRTPIARPRHPSFTPETLALFTELEAVPLRRRNTQGFKDGERELMRRLGMTDEFWTMNSPLDRDGPCHPEGYLANVALAPLSRGAQGAVGSRVRAAVRQKRKTPNGGLVEEG